MMTSLPRPLRHLADVFVAHVVGVEDDRAWIRSGDPGNAGSRLEARTTWSLRGRVEAGDEVLVLRGDAGLRFVIDILEKSAAAPTRRMVLPDGTTVSAEPDGDSRKLKIAARNGDLIFEYDTERRRARVCGAEGVTFDAGSGDLVLRAEGKVSLAAGDDISLATRSGLNLESGTDTGARSGVHIRPGTVGMESPRFRLRAEQAEITSSHAALTSRRVRMTAGRARIVVERMESVFEDVVQRATTVYRQVKDSIVTRAGRVRTVADTTVHVSSEHYVCRGRADIKMKSGKIHLG